MAVKILKRWFWGPYSRIGFIVAAIALVVDQAHKYYIVEVYRLGEKGRVEVLPFLDYVLSWNKGVSYGLFQQSTVMGAIGLVLFAFVAVLGLIVFLAHAESRLGGLGTGLIIGGALGNAFDRMHWPGVADYFALHAFGYSWYIFNIADVAIVVGVIALIWEAFVFSPKKAEKQS